MADPNDFQYMFDDNFDGMFDEGGEFPHEYYEDAGFGGKSEGSFNSWSGFSYTFPQCFYPTTQQVLYTIVLRSVAAALLLRVAALLRTPQLVIHLLSAGLGLVLVWFQFDMAGVKLFAVFEILGYMAFRLSPRRRGFTMSAFVLLFLFYGEAFVYDATSWHSWRGSLMIVGMKMISVGFDVDTQRLQANLPPVEHAGYCLSCTTVLFGPFLTYQTYTTLLAKPPVTLSWFVTVVRLVTTSYVCLILSSCVLPFALGDGAHKWLQAYVAAASFRYGHYFVCYLSEGCSVAAGLGGRQMGDNKWSWDGLPVVRLSHVELPRSLVEVVTNWNVAMHVFLKNYVYKPVRHLGMFPAILVTYFASALLHGMNFQLAAVLLSIGTYAYIENVFRGKVSNLLNACVMARLCQAECPHKHKYNVWWVRLLNMLFTALAMFHLAYLGLMFDNTAGHEKGHSMAHTLKKWSNLEFASHIVAFATYLIHLVLPARQKRHDHEN